MLLLMKLSGSLKMSQPAVHFSVVAEAVADRSSATTTKNILLIGISYLSSKKRHRRYTCPPDRASVNQFAAGLASIGLLCCGIRSRFDHDIYLRAWLEMGLLAILVSNDVLDANLSVQIVRFLNPDLCLLGCAWKRGLDDFLNRATQLALLLAHGETSNATPKFYVGLGLRVQQNTRCTVSHESQADL
jgi:hypothetical protein